MVPDSSPALQHANLSKTEINPLRVSDEDNGVMKLPKNAPRHHPQPGVALPEATGLSSSGIIGASAPEKNGA